MCGRFTLRTPALEIAETFALATVPEQLVLKFNIAPTTQVATIRLEHSPTPGSRELVMMRWGLIPSWATDMKIGASMINARADTVATKPAFRAAFKRRWCLVVADGFYEWQVSEDDPKKKQPYFVTVDGGKPFGFAALWEFWNGPEGPVESCSIITTEPNHLMAEIHDRMPVILPRDAWSGWLNPELQNATILQELLTPYPADRMKAIPVSTYVNNVRNQGPECIAPLAS